MFCVFDDMVHKYFKLFFSLEGIWKGLEKPAEKYMECYKQTLVGDSLRRSEYP